MTNFLPKQQLLQFKRGLSDVPTETHCAGTTNKSKRAQKFADIWPVHSECDMIKRRHQHLVRWNSGKKSSGHIAPGTFGDADVSDQRCNRGIESAHVGCCDCVLFVSNPQCTLSTDSFGRSFSLEHLSAVDML